MSKKKAQLVKAPADTSVEAYDTSRFNAVRHGVLSKHTVLPWEDEDEYRDLLNALVAEHRPKGPTEEHLVEGLAGIFWRKRRLRLAEGAAHSQSLRKAIDPFEGKVVKSALAHTPHYGSQDDAVNAVRSTESEATRELADLQRDLAMIQDDIEVAESDWTDAYKIAFEMVDQDTRDWWAEALAESSDRKPDSDRYYETYATDFARFLRKEVVRQIEEQRKEIANRPLIARQAYGESFDAIELERLARYGVHLDRKLERILTMLVKLRRQSEPA